MSMEFDLFPEFTEQLTWMNEGNCKDLPPQDVSLFFVESGKTIDPHVLDLCRQCPVRTECATWAYDRNRKAGYFGGMSPTQRDKMSRQEAVEFVQADHQRALLQHGLHPSQIAARPRVTRPGPPAALLRDSAPEPL